jgi:hypothetical protein
MSAKIDPVSEIASLFLEKDEVGQMMLDNVFGIIEEQVDLAEARIARGERPAREDSIVPHSSEGRLLSFSVADTKCHVLHVSTMLYALSLVHIIVVKPIYIGHTPQQESDRQVLPAFHTGNGEGAFAFEQSLSAQRCFDRHFRT